MTENLAWEACRLVTSRRVVLVYGKGGVGKTTVSLLLGLCLRRQGLSARIVSLDPAKHLPGYVGCDCINKPVETRGLVVEQYDVSHDIRRLGEEYALLLKRVASRVSALNLDNLLGVVTSAPGLEEEAYLRKLESIYASSADFDVTIVDMPPTGVALRIVALPRLYLVWLDALIEVRRRLAETRAMLARVAGGEYSDPVLDKLMSLRDRFARLAELVMDEKFTLHMGVATPEPLPVQELEMVAERLASLGAKLGLVVLNRVLGEREAEKLGLLEQQEWARERLRKLASVVVEVPYLGRPTKSLGDVEKLLGLLWG